MAIQTVKLKKKCNEKYSTSAILKTVDGYIILGKRRNTFALFPHLFNALRENDTDKIEHALLHLNDIEKKNILKAYYHNSKNNIFSEIAKKLKTYINNMNFINDTIFDQNKKNEQFNYTKFNNQYNESDNLSTYINSDIDINTIDTNINRKFFNNNYNFDNRQVNKNYFQKYKNNFNNYYQKNTDSILRFLKPNKETNNHEFNNMTDIILLGGQPKCNEEDEIALIRELNEELCLKNTNVNDIIATKTFLCFMKIIDHIFKISYYNKIYVIELTIDLKTMLSLFSPNREIQSLEFFKIISTKKQDYAIFLRQIFTKN